MLRHGVSPMVVSKMLGHGNASVTMSIYAHATLDMQDEAAAVMDQIVSPIAVQLPELHPIAPGQGQAGAKKEKHRENSVFRVTDRGLEPRTN